MHVSSGARPTLVLGGLELAVAPACESTTGFIGRAQPSLAVSIGA